MHNHTNESTVFCDSPLWDNNIFWLSPEPHFTPCFRRTILVTIGPTLLLLLIPLDFRYITNKRNTYSNPWRWRNATYAVLNLVIIVISFINMLRSVWKEVHLWSNVFEPSVDFIGLSISYILLIIFRRHGRRISITLSIYWFITLITCILRLYLEFNFSDNNNSEPNLIIYSFYISLSFNLLMLSCITDEPNRISLINNRRIDDNYCALEDNNVFSRLTLLWLTKFLYKGLRGRIETKDLNQICHSIQSKYVSKLFNRFDMKYNTKAINSLSRFCRKEKRLLPILWSLSYKYILFGLLLQLIYIPALFMQPYILDKLLNFLNNSDEYKWHGIMYAIIYCISGLIAAISLLHTDTLMENTAIRCKSALVSAVYKKIFKLSPASRREYTSGEIVNLMAVDCHEVFTFLELGMYVFIIPISFTIGCYFLWQYLGISSLGVVVVIIIVIPFTVSIGQKLDKLQKNQMKFKDKRMAKISEILNSIRIIKLNAWELPFIDSVSCLRKLELKSLRKLYILFSAIDSIWIMAPMLLSVTCFGAYALIDYSKFNATTIFVSLSILNLFGVPMAIIPAVFSRFIRATVSVKRLAKFLSAEELDKDSIIRDKRDNVFSISVENATLKWCLEEEPVLSDLTMNVRKGSLIGIVGEVGSGKSSLLSALMGDLYKMSGTIKVNGSLASVPQSAWIQNTSLKKNIIFMSNEDEIRYKEVISACALLPDIDILPAADNTQIGEKGINLSGGQKQRISLARAVYQDSDIYLLDDPLSAVDAHVAQHLFENVIGSKGLLRSKTRILCTHQISFVEEVDDIFVLRDGEIVGHGTYQELSSLGLLSQVNIPQKVNQTSINHTIIKANIDVSLECSSKANTSARKRSKNSISSNESQSLLRRMSTQSTINQVRSDSQLSGANFIEEEHFVTESVRWRDYGKYVASTGITLFIVFVFSQICFNGSEVAANYWLSLWTNLNNTNSDISDRNFRFIIYISLIANEGVFIILGNILLFFCAIKASEKLHSSAILGLLRSPISFFDKTPIGRILNRFSKDISSVDEDVPIQMVCFFEKITWFPILYGIIIVTSIYLALGLLVVVLLFYFVYVRILALDTLLIITIRFRQLNCLSVLTILLYKLADPYRTEQS